MAVVCRAAELQELAIVSCLYPTTAELSPRTDSSDLSQSDGVQGDRISVYPSRATARIGQSHSCLPPAPLCCALLRQGEHRRTDNAVCVALGSEAPECCCGVAATLAPHQFPTDVMSAAQLS